MQGIIRDFAKFALKREQSRQIQLVSGANLNSCKATIKANVVPFKYIPLCSTTVKTHNMYTMYTIEYNLYIMEAM